jgi:hypothetical protein
MLCVPALELGHPVLFVILVKANDSSLRNHLPVDLQGHFSSALNFGPYDNPVPGSAPRVIREHVVSLPFTIVWQAKPHLGEGGGCGQLAEAGVRKGQ